MSVRVGICGAGAFADSFIPLFRAHPAVREVILCDLDAEKLRSKAERFGISKTCPSLDELCRTDVDAVALFTQHHIHGPQAVQALEAGKHVMSETASNSTLAEGVALCRTVEKTGLIYMLAENYPYTAFNQEMRRVYRTGEIGEVTYAEGEYNHPMSPEAWMKRRCEWEIRVR